MSEKSEKHVTKGKPRKNVTMESTGKYVTDRNSGKTGNWNKMTMLLILHLIGHSTLREYFSTNYRALSKRETKAIAAASLLSKVIAKVSLTHAA